MADNDTRSRSNSNAQIAIIGAGLAAAAGTAAFLLAKRTGSGGVPTEGISDAPAHVWRRGSKLYDQNLLGNTVLVGRSPEELYAVWREFTRFPEFMENVEQVESLESDRSRWTIKAPAGTSVELVTTITEDKPNEAIAWKSDPESEITTEGRVEFLPAAAGRGTMVRLVQHYDPPGGLIGKGFAKVFQREPKIQARRDLRRFKSLMETGEVASNASPSGRASENPAEPHI